MKRLIPQLTAIKPIVLWFFINCIWWQSLMLRTDENALLDDGKRSMWIATADIFCFRSSILLRNGDLDGLDGAAACGVSFLSPTLLLLSRTDHQQSINTWNAYAWLFIYSNRIDIAPCPSPIITHSLHVFVLFAKSINTEWCCCVCVHVIVCVFFSVSLSVAFTRGAIQWSSPPAFRPASYTAII